MELTDVYKRTKAVKGAIKFYIFFTGIGLAFYVCLLCFGMRSCLSEFISMTLGMVLLCGGAWMFRLCWLSWSFLAYIYLVRTCMIVYRCGLFGQYIDIAHYIVFAIGAALTIYFIINLKKYKKNEESQIDSENA